MELTKYESKRLNECYYGYKHESGLRVFVYPKLMTTSYAMFATEYGSLENCFKTASDSEFTTVPAGIAHFLEHKMFENEDGSDTFERFGKTGASANAFTSFDKTAYLFSSTDNLYQSLEILLDFVTHPYFTKETVEKEQGIIAQEIQMYEDNPDTRVYYELMRNLYEKHDVRIEIAGTVKSISEITSDLLYKCYNTFYRPENMVLCVCGDVEPEKVKKIVDEKIAVGKIDAIERRYCCEKPEVFRKYSEIKMQVARPQFAIGVKDCSIPKDPKMFSKKDYAMKILNEILFGTSTEFFNDMYEKGILNGKFSCEYDSAKSFAYCYYSGETDDPNTFFEIFKSYIYESQRKSIDLEDFLRAKKTVYAEFVRLFDSTEEITSELVFDSLLDFDIFDSIDIIDSIDLSFVQELLTSFFAEERFAMSVVLPM